jgi:hypothetical protein
MVLILGESEIAAGSFQVKDLEAHSQETIERSQALRVVADRLMAASRTVDASPRRMPTEKA